MGHGEERIMEHTFYHDALVEMPELHNIKLLYTH